MQNPVDLTIDYGIHNEASDYRLHVCPVAGRMYVYPTAKGVEVIREGVYPKKPAYQLGMITAWGYLVPPEDIPRCFVTIPKPDFWKIAPIHEAMTTSQKGDAAVRLVKAAFRDGLIPIHMDVEFVTDYDEQIGGLDVKVQGRARIQVKCDLRGGEKAAGGTGNLFLQIAEANPLKQH